MLENGGNSYQNYSFAVVMKIIYDVVDMRLKKQQKVIKK